MSEHTRKLAAAIVAALPDATSVEEVLAELSAVTAAHFEDSTPKEAPVYTIDSVNEDGGSMVAVYPNGDKWVLFIPPTVPEHLGQEPYGSTHWDTLQGAVASLSLAVKNGTIQYNDGRAAT